MMTSSLSMPVVVSSRHGPLSTVSSSFSIPDVPPHAQQVPSLEEVFSRYEYSKQISTLANLVTNIFESEGVEKVKRLLANLPKLVTFNLESKGVTAALVADDNEVYIKSRQATDIISNIGLGNSSLLVSH